MRAILFCLLAALLLAMPMLLFGPLVDGFDTNEHVNFTRHFNEQFWQGELYPRWISGMNTGLGSPTLFIYPPLPIYATVLLSPLLHGNAFVWAAYLALTGSGIAAFLWLRTFVTETAATICACLYMLMPYHLAIDFYRRTALSECWAFVWMPLILYFTSGLIAGKRRSFPGLAICFALMILSHLISVAMFFAIPIAFALVISNVRAAGKVILAMALGTGISAVYLLPALAATRHISTSDLRERYNTYLNLLPFDRALFAHVDFEYFTRNIAWMVLSLVALGAICALTSWKKDRKFVLFWLIVCAGAVFIMSRASLPIWQSFGALGRAVQFPWRFVVILCFATLPLLALFLSSARPWKYVIVSIIAAYWLGCYGNVWWRYHVDVAQTKDPGQEVNDYDGWLGMWIPPGTIQSASLAASKGPQVCFRNAEGTARVLAWKPRSIEFESDSATGGAVMIRQFFYADWTARMLDGSQTVAVKAALPEGLLSIDAPPGKHRFRVEMPVSGAESVGRWVSAASLLAAIALLLI